MPTRIFTTRRSSSLVTTIQDQGSGGTVLFQDDFDRPDGPLGAPWVPLPGTEMSIVNGSVLVPPNTTALEYVNLAFPDDIVISADITFVNLAPEFGGDNVGLLGRFDEVTLNAYAGNIQWQTAPNDTEFWASRYDGFMEGAAGGLGVILGEPTGSVHMEFHMVGDDFWTVLEGIESPHLMDSTYASGWAGLFVISAGDTDGIRVDNFTVSTV